MFKLRNQIAPIFIFLIITGYTILMVVSCGDKKGGEWISNSPDTSALGRIHHFIGKDSISLLRKAFYGERRKLDTANPGLFITESEGFNKTALLKLLKNPDCVGIRIYYGVMDDKTKGEKGKALKLIIVGTNSQGKDLLIEKSALTDNLTDEGYGLEYGQCCVGSELQ